MGIVLTLRILHLEALVVDTVMALHILVMGMVVTEAETVVMEIK